METSFRDIVPPFVDGHGAGRGGPMKALLCFVLLTAPGAAAMAAGPLEVTPMVGIGKPSGEGSDNFSPGLRLGLSAGARLHPNISVHGMLGYDRLNPDDVPSSADISVYMAGVQGAALFHVIADRIDLALGPAVGLFYLHLSAQGLAAGGSASVRGYDLGLYATMLIAVNESLAVGPYFSFMRMWATKACETLGPQETCDDSPENDDEGFWSLGLGVRF
jgi:hypothetical protein